MEALKKSVEVVIRNEPSQMAVASRTLDRLAAELGIPAKPLAQLQVALDEIVSNVMKYAWPEEGTHELLVRFDVGDDSVEIHVIDDGQAYDPRQSPLREPPPAGQRPRPGGLGIQMVRQLVDGFDYTRDDGCNHTILTKRYAVGRSDDQHRT
jgi:anti-sigma regulatory factor (Ser/Thr protein kinase)